MNHKQLEITKSNSDCAQYTGTVTVASYLGDRLIKKETHHNEGLKSLFEFIGNCLQGNWYGARDSRPCKLVMLKQADGEILTDSELAALPDELQAITRKSSPNNGAAKDSKGRHYWSPTYAVCNPIMYDTAAIAESDDVSSSVTYHFRVPFLSLVGGSKIKKLMLLPAIATDYVKDACAYFILEDGIEIPTVSANLTVIIDWTLTFTNNASNLKEN